jgi:hypothetical protein
MGFRKTIRWIAVAIVSLLPCAAFVAYWQGMAHTEPAKYITIFPNAEGSISEGGSWHHLGTPWAVIRTIASPDRAVGTQTGSGGYNDSYAYLLGFPPNVTLSATIYKNPAIIGDPAGSHEVELLLRWADSSTTARGYECNLSFDGTYSQIVRWNGAFGDFTVLSSPASFPTGTMPPVTGDVFKATISGSTINVYINKNDGKGDQLINTATDTTWTDGNPGIGMWLEGSYDQTMYAFANFTAIGE